MKITRKILNKIIKEELKIVQERSWLDKLLGTNKYNHINSVASWFKGAPLEFFDSDGDPSQYAMSTEQKKEVNRQRDIITKNVKQEINAHIRVYQAHLEMWLALWAMGQDEVADGSERPSDSWEVFQEKLATWRRSAYSNEKVMQGLKLAYKKATKFATQARMADDDQGPGIDREGSEPADAIGPGGPILRDEDTPGATKIN